MRFTKIFVMTNRVWHQLISRRAVISIGILATIVGGLYVSMRVYLRFEAHRAAQMMAALSGIKIGDAEEAVSPVVNKYGGYRWTQPDKARAIHVRRRSESMVFRKRDWP